MSVVVAIKENGKVFVGADSQSSRGEFKKTTCNPNNFKIWKVRGANNCVMGAVGNKRDSNIVKLMNHLVTDYDAYNNNIDFEYVVKSIVPDIRNELRKYEFLKEDCSFFDSSFIFAFKDQLYTIGCDGAVLEIDDYMAIGSGESEALGSLISTEGLPPQERIIKAIKASSLSTIHVDYPIIITDTEHCEFDIITKENENEFIEGIREKYEEGEEHEI